MNDPFDELAKGLARSVTRRAALKKFGAGLSGVVLAALGLANKAEAAARCLPSGSRCRIDGQGRECCSGFCVTLSPGLVKYGVCR